MTEIRQAQLDEILAHVRAEFPREACGLLAGRSDVVERVFPMRNAEQSEVAYRLDPEEQYRVFMEMERRGWELVGIYHSHPHGPAYPSARDIETAYYPETVYLIVSLAEGAAPVLRGFRIREGRVAAEELEITSGPGK